MGWSPARREPGNDSFGGINFHLDSKEGRVIEQIAKTIRRFHTSKGTPKEVNNIRHQAIKQIIFLLDRTTNDLDIQRYLFQCLRLVTVSKPHTFLRSHYFITEFIPKLLDDFKKVYTSPEGNSYDDKFNNYLNRFSKETRKRILAQL